MFKVVELFRKGGGRFHRRGFELIVLNVIVTAALVIFIFVQGEQQRSLDRFDIIFEAGSCLIHFGMFCICAFIRLKSHIRWTILVGAFFTQCGLMVDFIDEFVFIDSPLWHKIGDLAYFSGALMVAVGIINWVSYGYQVSMLDGLTRLHNRRFFEGFTNQYLLRLQRVTEQASLLMIDLDNFKSINDDFGHSKGDQVLKTVADILRQCIRKQDLVCRSGGEEFEILLVGTDSEHAVGLVKRIQQRMLENTPTGMPTLTASIGITTFSPQDTLDAARVRADNAMYQAKRNGKNQYVIQ